jgi:hypothetical protein
MTVCQLLQDAVPIGDRMIVNDISGAMSKVNMTQFKVVPQNSPGTEEDHGDLPGQLVYQTPPECL